MTNECSVCGSPIRFDRIMCNSCYASLFGADDQYQDLVNELLQDDEELRETEVDCGDENG